MDVDEFSEQTLEKVVSKYRGFGAPVLFTCGHKVLQWWSFTTQKPMLEGKVSAAKVANFFNEPFFVIYSDNFSQWDIVKLKLAYESQNAIAAVAVHWREDITKSGMVELGENNRILRFVEKPRPQNVKSHYVNAGFFYLNPKILDYIPDGEFYDFGFHVFPEMILAGEKIYAVKMEEPIIGIDTIEYYKKANELAKKLKDAR